jgi:hypothetical protein
MKPILISAIRTPVGRMSPPLSFEQFGGEIPPAVLFDSQKVPMDFLTLQKFNDELVQE